MTLYGIVLSILRDHSTYVQSYAHAIAELLCQTIRQLLRYLSQRQYGVRIYRPVYMQLLPFWSCTAIRCAPVFRMPRVDSRHMATSPIDIPDGQTITEKHGTAATATIFTRSQKCASCQEYLWPRCPSAPERYWRRRHIEPRNHSRPSQRALERSIRSQVRVRVRVRRVRVRVRVSTCRL